MHAPAMQVPDPHEVQAKPAPPHAEVSSPPWQVPVESQQPLHDEGPHAAPVSPELGLLSSVALEASPASSPDATVASLPASSPPLPWRVSLPELLPPPLPLPPLLPDSVDPPLLLPLLPLVDTLPDVPPASLELPEHAAAPNPIKHARQETNAFIGKRPFVSTHSQATIGRTHFSTRAGGPRGSVFYHFGPTCSPRRPGPYRHPRLRRAAGPSRFS